MANLKCKGGYIWVVLLLVSTGGIAQNLVENLNHEFRNARIRRASKCINPGWIEGSVQIKPGSGDWVSDSCDPKVFYTIGNHTRICQDGDWSSPPPICIHKAFAGPVVREVMFEGRMVKTTCTAQLGTPPDCKREFDGITIDSLPTSSCSDPIKENYKVTGDTRVSGFVTGVEYEVQCDNGFVLDGDSKITCGANAKWNPSPPNCVGSGTGTVTDSPSVKTPPTTGGQCPDPGAIDHGEVELDKDYSKASYSCKDGYLLEGVDFRSCSKGSWSETSPRCVECGQVPIESTPTFQIAAGTPSTEGQWPWMAAILREDTILARQSCGGSLINKNWVLTAAHCLVVFNGDQMTGDPAPLQYFVVMLAKQFRSRITEGKTQVHQLSKMILHSGFNPKFLHNDIGLLRLSTSAVFNEWVQPVCLPDPTDIVEQTSFRFGATGYVIGMGYSSDANLLEVLNHVAITVRPTRFCDRNNISRLNDNAFCAGDSISEKAVCRGDSGGPFVFQHPVNNRWLLEGIVSFKLGQDCGTVTFYSVFTRVEKYLNWIYNNMKETS